MIFKLSKIKFMQPKLKTVFHESNRNYAAMQLKNIFFSW